VRIESERVNADRSAMLDALKRAQQGLDSTRIARAARESELASARIEHEWRASQVRAREHELAGLGARLTSLEQLEAARAGFSDAARAVLANANGAVNQKGAVADYIEVNTGYERAVDACLSDLLQHVVVERPEHASAGFSVVRDADAGRCGFLIAEGVSSGVDSSLMESGLPEGVVAVSSVVQVNGDFATAIRHAIGEAWIADSYERAEAASRVAACPVVTRTGEVFRGPNLVTGGIRRESHGILETRREIKDLRERIASERDALTLLAEETAALDTTIAQALAAIDALTSEHHKQEKAIVAHEARLQQTADEAARHGQKVEQLTRERRQAEEERETIDRRQAEARVSISRLETEQRTADDRLSAAQRRLFEARESAEALSQQAADARASHAGLVERATALAGEVERLEEAGAELEARAASLAAEREQTRRRIDDLRTAIAAGKQKLDDDMRALEAFRGDVANADESASALRVNAEEHEAAIKQARLSLETLRTAVSELDIARATAESDLSHLASSCVEAVQATLDDVVAEVEELERQGEATPDARAIYADQSEESETDEEGASTAPEAIGVRAVEEATQRALSAEEAIAELRRKIDRLGPVNMMAIEQFDELESRHGFLTTQRKDLVDSIAQTTEAIKRIDETTRQRFAEAFVAINRNFQETFNTLFGGGRAGLTLLDENDPLESGIEIVAQPPGKRLQSVQLLSGGEKALTAIALMFGLFKYKPSPFCLLDEIDAPLDDANVGRFVEMLRAMLHHTQFILITHNRKTMEIADRLYGVTMEEPGVSKLISVQLN
jgi:chromosome segregation protein